MADPNKAVFLSYASQDTEAAQTLCNALRAAGIEVWFDQSELRGGDAWDQKIRREIHDCALFIPIVSQHTQERLEGYFRREWKLAIDRTHDMAEQKPFLVPVVVDGTGDREAFVPDAFRAVQWTRLPGGETPPAFVERIKRLLSAELSPSSPASGGASALKEPISSTRRSTPVLLAIIAVVVCGALAYFVADRSWLSKPTPAEKPVATMVPAPTAATPAIPEKSVAVLPFVDMSEKKDQEYFADGMAEEILSLLAAIPALKVVGRTSSFQFKGQSRDLRKIGEALGVNYVVEGSVRRSGDRVRLTAQLIDAHTGTHLWSGTFERPMGDALKMQVEIAENLARALQISLGAGDLELRPSLPNVDAYNLYLRGLHAVDQLDEAGFQEAVGYFKQSIDLDPTFAPAAGWLAMVYDMQGEWGYVASTTAFEDARRTAEATVKINPGFFLPYTVLASIHQVYDWDWAAGEAAVNRSIELAPREPLVHFFASRYALMVGRLDDALAHIQATLARDPLMPTAYVGVCWIQQRRGHLPEAEAAIRRALEISPSFVSGHYYLGLVLLALGEPKIALEAMRQEMPIGGQLDGLAIVYFALGRRADSDAALARLLREYSDVGAFGIAEVYAYRGEFDQAFKWLERAYTQRDSSLYLIKGDPLLQRLEGDARYKAFLRKMNLPE